MSVNYGKYLYSTGTHYISNSGKDEHNAYRGGAAGDQTGREWELRKWYSRPWTVVLRYPDQAVALKIAELGIAAALNDKIGYDQGQRATYWKQLKAAGYDPSRIAAACEDDCTAGVSANVRAAGHLFGIQALQGVPLCSSRNMRAEFTKAGFTALAASKYLKSAKCLLPGDILLCENHHAATNVTLGASVKSDWHPGSVPAPTVKTVRVTGGTVNVRSAPGTGNPVIGIAKKGEIYPYTAAENGWYNISYRGANGWVSGKYAEMD